MTRRQKICIRMHKHTCIYIHKIQPAKHLWNLAGARNHMTQTLVSINLKLSTYQLTQPGTDTHKNMPKSTSHVTWSKSIWQRAGKNKLTYGVSVLISFTVVLFGHLFQWSFHFPKRYSNWFFGTVNSCVVVFYLLHVLNPIPLKRHFLIWK
jgi:hypothetical protein